MKMGRVFHYYAVDTVDNVDKTVENYTYKQINRQKELAHQRFRGVYSTSSPIIVARKL